MEGSVKVGANGGRVGGGRPFGAAVRALGVLCVVGLIAVATSCSATSSTEGVQPSQAPGATTKPTVVPADEGRPVDGGKLAFGIETEPNGLNPQTDQYSAPGHLIVASMFEALMTFDENKAPKPFLAESMVPTELALHWTITLKPNITFHDGTPLNAEVVKANIESAQKSILSVGLQPIDTVDVKSELVAQVNMKQPWASFPAVMAGQPGYLMAPSMLGDSEGKAQPVGTGPFELDHWDRGSVLAVKKNPDYWQPGKPHLDRIDYKILPDPRSRASSLEAGDLDIMSVESPQLVADYRGKSDYRTIVDASGDAEVVILNEGRPPFDNLNARKAVVLATDPAALAETLGAGVLEPTDQPFAEGSAYHQDDPHYPKHDLEAAKKAAQQYTAETGKPLEFTLTMLQGQGDLAEGQVLQEQWKEAGIQANIRTLEYAEGTTQVITGGTEASLNRNFGYPDPDFNYIFWHSSFTSPVPGLSINFAHLKSPEIDQKLLEGRVDLIPEQRQTAYKDAVRLINEDFSHVWMYRFVGALVAKKRVHGLHQAEQNGIYNLTAKNWFQDLWLEKA